MSARTPAELPYHGPVTLVLDYADGGELSFTGIELLVSRTSSAGILDVAGSGLDAALAEPGLCRARLVLSGGAALVGTVTYINRVGQRFVLCLDPPSVTRNDL